MHRGVEAEEVRGDGLKPRGGSGGRKGGRSGGGGLGGVVGAGLGELRCELALLSPLADLGAVQHGAGKGEVRGRRCSGGVESDAREE